MMSEKAPQDVYKVATRAAWNEACRNSVYCGSADDLRDGFVHLSTRRQLAGTLERHFKGQSDLVLISFKCSDLGAALKWEPSRNGDLFPHLYAVLPTAAARAVYELRLNANGIPELPVEITQ